MTFSGRIGDPNFTGPYSPPIGYGPDPGQGDPRALGLGGIPPMPGGVPAQGDRQAPMGAHPMDRLPPIGPPGVPGIHWFGPGGTHGIDYPPQSPAPQAGGGGGGGVPGGLLSTILHSLIGGGQSAMGFHPGAPTPPPGVTAPPAGSYNPAQFYLATGHPQYAAQLWESHHPYAMAHGHIPHWVTQALLHAINSATPHAQAAPVPTNQAQ